jgi:AraC-like DNA-binding protein
MVVKLELDKLGLHYTRVELGETEILEDISTEQMDCLKVVLKASGLEVMDDKKRILVEKIKTTIIELVHYTDHQNKINLSDYLSEKLNHPYPYLYYLFSEVNGTSIEKYYLGQKIERVKEVLVNDGFTLSDIAYKLHYSSEGHLSKQFKKKTGLTTSQFKNLKNNRRYAFGDV